MSRRKRPNVNPRVKGGKAPKSTHAERLEYARKEFERDGKISLMGNNGMHARCKEVFGVSPTYEQLREVKTEVAKAQREAYKAKLDAEDRANKHPVLTPEQAQALKSSETAKKAWATRREKEAMRPYDGEHLVAGRVVRYRAPLPDLMSPTLQEQLREGRGTTMSAEDVKVRLAYTEAMYEQFPGARQDEVRAAVRSKFGHGISNNHSGDIRKRVHKRLVQKVARDYFTEIPGTIGMSFQTHCNELRKRLRSSMIPMGDSTARSYARAEVLAEQQRRRSKSAPATTRAPAEDGKKKVVRYRAPLPDLMSPTLQEQLREGRGTTMSAEDVKVRLAYTEAMYEQFPDARQDEVRTAVRYQFGDFLHQTLVPMGDSKEAPVRKSATSQENVRTALQMIREEIPDLSRLELVVPRDGKPTVSIERHTVEEFGLEGDEA